MIKKSVSNLIQINAELQNYLYQGYDLHFVHGWFCAYLSAPSDSEEDLLIPTYLILNESKISDEAEFARLIDKLVAMYSNLADAIFEQNKLLRPLVDLAKPNSFDPLKFTSQERRNLFMWLYGYLTGYLVIGADITEYAANQELLDTKFFPALFTLCVALFSLSSGIDLEFMEARVRDDFAELKEDLQQMWESDDEEADVAALLSDAAGNLDLLDLLGALNDVFYVVRLSDENRFSRNQQPELLAKLVTKH